MRDVEAMEARNLELALAAADAADEGRAEEIQVLDMRALVDYSDYFVIASAPSVVRLKGVSKQVEKRLAKRNARLLNTPDRDNGWILLDFGDVMIHLFDHPAREFYRLEDLWGDAPRVEWQPAANAKTKTSAPGGGAGNAGRK